MGEQKKNPGAKKEKVVMPFFNEMVSVYFGVYESLFGLRPSFDGSSPRDLKSILEAMRVRCEENQSVWTEMMAAAMLTKFLQVAATDVWLKDNFLLFNLNRQKDKIFLKIKSEIDGKSNSKEGGGKFGGSYKTAGQAVFAERLKGRIERLQRDGQDDH